MFFIFGSPRSGTTLLARILGAHPDIVIPHETDFLVPMAFVCDRVRDASTGKRLVADLVVGGNDFAASIGEFLTETEARAAIDGAAYTASAMAGALYAAVARRAGKRLAGDKSPNDLHFIRILHKAGMLAPPARCLHIVRDVRDVVVSLQKTGWAPDLAHYFARQWSNANLYLHGAMRGDGERYLLLRYEDLAADPAASIERACALLGVPFDAAMLAPAARAHARYQHMAHHARLAQPISASSVGQYREQLEPGLRQACERQAGEALEAFGYGSSSAMP
jgi:hypothetical protein